MIKQGEVKTGLDKLSVTLKMPFEYPYLPPKKLSERKNNSKYAYISEVSAEKVEKENRYMEESMLSEILAECFENITIADFERIRDNREDAFYRVQYILRIKTPSNPIKEALLVFNTRLNPVFSRGIYHSSLVVHGLAFSASSYNALRPLNLQKLAAGLLKLNVKVSKFDAYIDEAAGLTPVDDLYFFILPINYKQYISSYLVRDKNKIANRPQEFSGSIYFGSVPKWTEDGVKIKSKKGFNQVNGLIFYKKHDDPAHAICTEENKLKFEWHRWEARPRSDTAAAEGKIILQVLANDPANLPAAIVHFFSGYFNWVEPVGERRVSLCKPQPWWANLLAKAEES